MLGLGSTLVCTRCSLGEIPFVPEKVPAVSSVPGCRGLGRGLQSDVGARTDSRRKLVEILNRVGREQRLSKLPKVETRNPWWGTGKHYFWETSPSDQKVIGQRASVFRIHVITPELHALVDCCSKAS